MRKSRLTLDGASLTLDQLRQFERERPEVELAAAARARMRESEATVVATVESGRTAYGINTGFGAFANRVIPAQKTQKLQLNLVRSHACGVGEPLPATLVRRMLLLKANNLAAGFSGVRPLRMTVAPSEASSCATQRPMPLPEPVTQCTWPANRSGRNTL